MTNKMTYVKALEIAMKAVEDNKEVTEKLKALKESIFKTLQTLISDITSEEGT